MYQEQVKIYKNQLTLIAEPNTFLCYHLAAEQTDENGQKSGLLKTPAFRRAQSEALDRAATWLERIGLLEHANRQASNLAYGDQRRLEIARCMVQSAVLLLHGEEAHSLYFSQDAFEQLQGDNKELTVIPNASHVDLYDQTDVIPFDQMTEF